MDDAQIWTIIGALYVFPIAMYLAARWLDTRFREAEERIFGRSDDRPTPSPTTAANATRHASTGGRDS